MPQISLKMLKCEVVCHPANNIFYQRLREDGERNQLKNESYHTVWCYKRHKYKELWERRGQCDTALWGGGQRSPDRWLALHQGLRELERNPASVNAQPCQREWSSQTVGSCPPPSQTLLFKLWEPARALSGVRSPGRLAAPFKSHRV